MKAVVVEEPSVVVYSFHEWATLPATASKRVGDRDGAYRNGRAWIVSEECGGPPRQEYPAEFHIYVRKQP